MLSGLRTQDFRTTIMTISYYNALSNSNPNLPNGKLHISAVKTSQELLIGPEGFSPVKRKNNITCNRKPVGYFNPPKMAGII